MNRHIAVALTLVVGMGIGAAAVQGLHAQAKPPAFSIVEITVTNQEAYNKEYVPLVVTADKNAGGKFLAQAGRTMAFEGTPPATRVALLQWDSLDKLEAFQNSSAYKDIQTIGRNMRRSASSASKASLSSRTHAS